MVNFIEQHMPGLAVPEAEFDDGSWTSKIEDLLRLPRAPRNSANGAEQTGKFILSLKI